MRSEAMATTTPQGNPKVDIDKIKDALKKAGVPVDDKNRLDQLSQELSKAQGSATPQFLVCKLAHYCLVVTE
jgi:hypothetical protein